MLAHSKHQRTGRSALQRLTVNPTLFKLDYESSFASFSELAEHVPGFAGRMAMTESQTAKASAEPTGGAPPD